MIVEIPEWLTLLVTAIGGGSVGGWFILWLKRRHTLADAEHERNCMKADRLEAACMELFAKSFIATAMTVTGDSPYDYQAKYEAVQNAAAKIAFADPDTMLDKAATFLRSPGPFVREIVALHHKLCFESIETFGFEGELPAEVQELQRNVNRERKVFVRLYLERIDGLRQRKRTRGGMSEWLARPKQAVD